MIRNLKKMMRDEKAVGITVGITCCNVMLHCSEVMLACLGPTPQGPSLLEMLLAIIS